MRCFGFQSCSNWHQAEEALEHSGKNKERRISTREIEWCIPGVKANDNELPELGAKRELREEIGYDAHHMQLFLEKKSYLIG